MQTSYGQKPAVGFPGMVADSGDRHVKSRVNPSVVIPYGLGVTKGTDDDHVKLPTTSAEALKCQGVAIADFATEQIANGSDPAFPVKSAVPVLSKGRVWVKVEIAVVAGDQATVRFADGNSSRTQKGAFGNTVDQVASANTAELINARYETSAAAGGLAILDLNLP